MASTTSRYTSEWDEANFFTKWTYNLINKMINNGTKRPLEFNDLMKVPSRDRAKILFPLIYKHYHSSNRLWFIPKLLIALVKIGWDEAIIINGLTLVEGAIRVAMPTLLISLLNALTNDESDAIAYQWAAILSGLSIFQCIIHSILFLYSWRIGWNWRVATTALIHNTLFHINNSSIQSSGSGRLVNLISNDVSRFEDFTVFAAFGWCAILEVIAILVLLIKLLDVPSAFAGVGVTTLSIPLMMKFGNLFAGYRSKTAKITDRRVRQISEIIDGITSVKSYGWETPFFHMIRQMRIDETDYIRQSQVLRAINQGLNFSIPAVTSFVTFAVYWGTGGKLTIAKVFAVLSYLQTLRQTLKQLMRSIETGSEALASAQRIEIFLKSNHQQTAAAEPVTVTADKATTTIVAPLASENILEMRCSDYYYYGQESQKIILHDISFTVARGEVVMVVGAVGSGKSSLLSAILGELSSIPKGDGDSSIPHRLIDPTTNIAYCSQRPWIISSTAKSNIILAGKTMNREDYDYKDYSSLDEAMYTLAIESCQLTDDMLQWTGYDETEIGERGISVSGGQKARLALARAVYSDADLYVLDDPLSAVDAQVGQALYCQCIENALKKRNKAVILVTHQLQYLKFADKIIVLSNDGHQRFYGTYEELRAYNESHHVLELPIGDGTESIRSTTGTPYQSSVSFQDIQSKKEADKLSNKSSTRSATAIATTASASEKNKIIQSEDRETGSVSTSVYWNYLTAGGIFRGIYVLLLVLFSQGLSMITDYWLRWWASEKVWEQSSPNYVIILAALMLSCVFFGFYRAVSWFGFTLNAAINLHERSFWAILHSPLRFFIANPTGRILNRFAKDQNQVDETLPFVFFISYEGLVYCFSGCIVVCISIPYLTILFVPLAIAFLLLRKKYLASSREIKRYEAITRSPIYSDFSATLDGLITLRAYRLEKQFSSLFQNQLDTNGRPCFTFLLATRWFGFRLDLEASLVVVFVCMLSVVLRKQVDVGLIGFALVYTFALSGLFQYTVRQSAEVESQITSVERINTYANLLPEEGYSTSLAQVLAHHQEKHGGGIKSLQPVVDGSMDTEIETQQSSTPTVPTGSNVGGGHVLINHLEVKYREDLDPVLKNISVNIPNGAKVGICGRTGSGKSTTLLALLRLNMITHGEFYINGINMITSDLETLRSQMTMIPQDPHLFSGTVRYNLDPFDHHSDEEIWQSLRDAHMYDSIAANADGLQANIQEGGKNFSVGQRQLFSMARAILRHSKIILMDEVTASIDFQTDKLIQQTIRQIPSFKNATIITVAHRLRTIADSDMIVVVNNGLIAETGTPIELLNQSESIFHSLAQESNEFDDIYTIASNAASAVSE